MLMSKIQCAGCRKKSDADELVDGRCPYCGTIIETVIKPAAQLDVELCNDQKPPIMPAAQIRVDTPSEKTTSGTVIRFNIKHK